MALIKDISDSLENFKTLNKMNHDQYPKSHKNNHDADVGEWRRVIGNEDTLCRLCGVEEETGTHLVFGCSESYELRPWDWTSWEELNDKRRWRYTVEGEGGKMLVRDRVEVFFVALDRVLVGVG